MDDLISRQAAIDAVSEAWKCGAYYTETINAIKDLPFAQPERKKGKWIRKEIHSNWSDWTEDTCSLCGATFKRLYKANFCPNCGAQMSERIGGTNV